MAQQQRIQGHQFLREAEGYLEIISALDGRFPLRPELAAPLARRALKILNRIELDVDHFGQLRFLQGRAWASLEAYPLALEFLHKASQWMPDSVDVWLAQASCHRCLNQMEDAIQSATEANLIDAHDPRPHYELARCWSLSQRPELAVDHLRQLFFIDPEYRQVIDSEPDFDPVRKDPKFIGL